MILAVCMNPVFQRILIYDRIKCGEVNRTDRIEEMGSGKGVNVARAALALGYKSRVVLPLGGDKGKLVKRFLKAENMPKSVVTVQAETRTCATLIETRPMQQTELVEEGNPLSPAEIESVFAEFRTLLEKKTVEMVVISGAGPKGTPEGLYRRLVSMAHEYSAPVIIDARHELVKNCLDLNPWMVKMNLDEFRATFGIRLPGTAELKRIMSSLSYEGDRWAVTTMGADGLVAFHGEQGFRARVPRIRAFNAVGSGDAVSAGFAIAHKQGYDDVKMIKFASACGVANALISGPGRLKPEDVARFEQRVDVVKF